MFNLSRATAAASPLDRFRSAVASFLAAQSEHERMHTQVDNRSASFKNYEKTLHAVQRDLDAALRFDFSATLEALPALLNGLGMQALLGQLSTLLGLLVFREIWRQGFPGLRPPALPRQEMTAAIFSSRRGSAGGARLPRDWARKARPRAFAQALGVAADPNLAFWGAWNHAREREATYFDGALERRFSPASEQSAALLGQMWAYCGEAQGLDAGAQADLLADFSALFALGALCCNRRSVLSRESFAASIADAALAASDKPPLEALAHCSIETALGLAASPRLADHPIRRRALGRAADLLKGDMGLLESSKISAFCWLRLDREAIDLFESSRTGFRESSLDDLHRLFANGYRQFGPWSMGTLAAALRSPAGLWAHSFFLAQQFDPALLAEPTDAVRKKEAVVMVHTRSGRHRLAANPSWFQRVFLRVKKSDLEIRLFNGASDYSFSKFHLADTLTEREAASFLALRAAAAFLQGEDIYSAVLQSWKIGKNSKLGQTRRANRL